jgi:hypothetical protein
MKAEINDMNYCKDVAIKRLEMQIEDLNEKMEEKDR